VNWPLVLLLAGLAVSGLLGVWLYCRLIEVHFLRRIGDA